MAMDWKKWGKKLLKNLGVIIFAGVVSVYGQSQWFLIIAPAFYQAENWWKHRD